jgi:hypothetical protein
MQTYAAHDSHAQLRRLYLSLLERQENFDEFKHLLSLYPHTAAESPETESVEAVEVRELLNDRIRDWVGDFEGLNAVQVMLWRSIVVEERFNVAVSPWKESNVY